MVTVQEIDERIEELDEQKKQVQPITSQRIPRRRFGSSVTPEQQQQVVQRRQQAKQAVQQIEERKQQLQRARPEAVEFERRKAEAEAYNADLRKAQKVFDSTNPAAIFALENSRQRMFYRQLVAGRRAQERSVQQPQLPEGAIGTAQGGGFIFPEGELTGQSIEGPQRTFVGRPTPQTNVPGFQSFDFEPREIQQVQTIDPSQLQSREVQEQKSQTQLERGVRKVLNTVDVVPPIFIPGTRFTKERAIKTREAQKEFIVEFIPTTRRQGVETVAAFGVGSVAGAGLRAGGTALARTVPKVTSLGGRAAESIGIKGATTFIDNLGKRAIKVTSKTTGVFALGAGGVAVGQASAEAIASGSQKEAAQIAARTSREFIAFGGGLKAGQRGFDKGVDLVRTRGLQEIPSEQIVAPEFFKGQRFPQIKKGQTAGQLQKEFLEPVLPGEARGVARGFTATPEPFAKNTKLLPGSSEVPGGFSAPRVSPNFLRISGEKSPKFGLDILTETNRPTVVRLTPKSLELAPGVKPQQSNLRPLDQGLKKFFEDIRGSGRSVIPFIKTEKETVTAVDTPVRRTAKRFFFKFQGRRVPIEEFGVVDDVAITRAAQRNQPQLNREQVKRLSEVLKSSSEGRIRSSPSFTPANILKPSISVSRSSKRTKSSISSLTSSSSIPSSVTKSGVSRVSKSQRSRRSSQRAPSSSSLSSLSRSPSIRSLTSSGGSSSSRRRKRDKTAGFIFRGSRGRLNAISQTPKFRDDIVLSQGFTARILKFKPIKISQKQLKTTIPKFQTIGTRRAPIPL